MIKWRNLGGFQNEIERLSAMSPYELLGISLQVNEIDLKLAYRKKIAIYHPDRTDAFVRQHGEEVAKLLNRAYDKIRKEKGFDNQ